MKPVELFPLKCSSLNEYPFASNWFSAHLQYEPCKMYTQTVHAQVQVSSSAVCIGSADAI